MCRSLYPFGMITFEKFQLEISTLTKSRSTFYFTKGYYIFDKIVVLMDDQELFGAITISSKWMLTNLGQGQVSITSTLYKSCSILILDNINVQLLHQVHLGSPYIACVDLTLTRNATQYKKYDLLHIQSNQFNQVS